MSEFELIEYQLRDKIAYIRLNQPKTLNALSGEMAKEIMLALDKGIKESRVIVFSGNGRGFCSGANLSGGGNINLDDPDRDMGIRLEQVYNPMLLKLRDLPIPFITSVRGPAVGFGCGLALMGDIICLLYTSPSPRDQRGSRMPSSA